MYQKLKHWYIGGRKTRIRDTSAVDLCPRVSGFWSRATWLVAGSEELDVGLERLILVHERALGAFLWIKKIERRS